VVRLGALLLALLPAACGSTPAPGPEDEGACAVAMAVRTSFPGDSRWGRPQTIYFVRLEEAGDPTTVGEVIRSNHAHAGVAYLLNARPGHYAAVAGTEVRDGSERTTYFPADMIRKTLTRIDAKGFALLGSCELRQRKIGTTADDAQRHYRPLIEPDWSRKNVLSRVFERNRYFIGRDFRFDAEVEKLRAKAQQHLAASGWRLE
jgi:hypothetical protein